MIEPRIAARLAARCYPRAWRKRYGTEFDALLADSPVCWRDVVGILGGVASAHWSPSLAAVVLILGASFSWRSCDGAAVPLALLALNFLLGTPAIRDGDTLYLATRQLSVPAVCDAANYWLALAVVITAAYARWSERSRPTRRHLLNLAALPATISAEAARIAWTGYLAAGQTGQAADRFPLIWLLTALLIGAAFHQLALISLRGWNSSGSAPR